MLITSYGYIVVAKNAKTDLGSYLNYHDLNHVVDPSTIPAKRYSKELNILSSREQYKTLTYLYDICMEYKNTRFRRIFRNFFQDENYEKCLGAIAFHIKSVLLDEKSNPEEILSQLKIFAQVNLDQKTFPSSAFPRFAYTMNRLLESTIYFCDYVSQFSQSLIDKPEEYPEYKNF